MSRQGRIATVKGADREVTPAPALVSGKPRHHGGRHRPGWIASLDEAREIPLASLTDGPLP